MQKEILEYIQGQNVGVLAVEMMDGSPHGATVHFAHTDTPLVLYFETNKDYKKSEALLGREKTRATFVIGVTESEPKTMQLDGVVEVLKDSDMELFSTVYLGKFPKKKDKAASSNSIFFKFTPTWWRYSDFANPNGKLILASDA